ncbi:TATA binding protein associated factor, partial [Pseudoloma neurophilia]
LINVKRTRANRKNKIVYPRLAISKKYNFFVNKKFYEETRDDFKMEFKFKNDIENENDLIWHIKQAILDQQIGSYLYNKAVQYLEDLHNSKFEIDLENAGEFTILKPEDKKALTKHLDNLNIPRCNRHKKYKDVVGKTETICSMKKKLENVAVVEMVQREIAIFLENIRFFDQETDLNEGPLLEYLDSLEITEIKSISELLIECLEIIKTKKCAAPFIEFDKTDRSKITISLIQEKITKYEYKNLKEVTDDMERIVSIAEEFDNSSKYTDDAKASFKWFKKVVGGMLGGLFDSD